MKITLVLILLCAAGPSAAWSDEVDFLRDVQPILAARCYSCHGPQHQESNYRLDVRDIALGTADSGDSPIVPGDASVSPLIELVAAADPDFRMPPAGAGPPLTAAQIDVLRRWIDGGAVWPDEVAGDASARITTRHWSFQPVHQPSLPADGLPGEFAGGNEIDRFVAARLGEHGLTPSPPADRVSLIRRLYLTMHGLHPSPQQVEEFARDSGREAWRQQVEQVLASPHYGERWARHWLDVVRFGESTGFEVNRDRSNAWYYRDYVIDSLNHDKPWPDFVIEQLAGDAVGVDEATGFLTGGPHDIVKSPDIGLTRMQRQNELADYVQTTSAAFLGLTVGCARCHNHKFDPILQRDYYALQAVFAGVAHGERPLPGRAPDGTLESLKTKRAVLAGQRKQLDVMREAAPPLDPADLREPVNPQRNEERFSPLTARFVRMRIFRTTGAEPCLDELEIFGPGTGNNLALASGGAVASSAGDYQGNPKHQLVHLNDGKYGNNHSWISDTAGQGQVRIELPEPALIDRVVWGRDRDGTFADRLPIDYAIEVSLDGRQWQMVADDSNRAAYLQDGQEMADAFISRLQGEMAREAAGVFATVTRLEKEISELESTIPRGYVGIFRQPDPVFRLHRGEPRSPREPVGPDTLSVMGTLGLAADASEQQRRLALARWIGSPDNPLTARVIVNRVWHYHFGTGIVTTPSDFGKNGGQPSHPALLDWLAGQFMENGWSLKWLHRQILLSATWRQSSRPRTAALARDADSRWLWRFPPRRLEAEAIRDCILQLSGKLNPQAGGPGFLLFEIDRENVHHYFPLEEFNEEHFRRMVYMTKIRQEQDGVFGVFDCPDGGQTIPDRNRSTTPLQALNLFNSKFMLEQAGFLASRLEAEAGDDLRDQIGLAFRLACSRQPTALELERAVDLVERYGLRAFCRALMNSNEFLFVG